MLTSKLEHPIPSTRILTNLQLLFWKTVRNVSLVLRSAKWSLQTHWRHLRKRCQLCGRKAEQWVIVNKFSGTTVDWTLCRWCRRRENFSMMYGMNKQQVQEALYPTKITSRTIS